MVPPMYHRADTNVVSYPSSPQVDRARALYTVGHPLLLLAMAVGDRQAVQEAQASQRVAVDLLGAVK